MEIGGIIPSIYTTQVERWRMSRNVFGLVYEPGKPLSISIPVRE